MIEVSCENDTSRSFFFFSVRIFAVVVFLLRFLKCRCSCCWGETNISSLTVTDREGGPSDDPQKQQSKRSIHRAKSVTRACTAPTISDIQKKFDEQSFKHQLSKEWATVRKKAMFVPSEITKSVTSGEHPHVVILEETFTINIAQRIFLLFDQPEHCILGEILSFITMVVITVSCVGYIASTGARINPDTCPDPACSDDPILCPGTMICPPEELPIFELIETACIAFFTVDYVIRVTLVPFMPARLAGVLPGFFDKLNSNAVMPTPVYSKRTTLWRYLSAPMNIIDLVAILPFYVSFFSASGSSVSIIRILRLVRVLRVFKIGGMGNGISLMTNAMMNSLSAMGILLFFTVLGVILFGSIIFFLEAGTFQVTEEFPDGAFLRWNVKHTDREESPFSSILMSCYWAMVTFTTVGYGDLVPTSPFGRFVALMLMYTGILVLALPISVIGANFQQEYERQREEEEDELYSEVDQGELTAVNISQATELDQGRRSPSPPRISVPSPARRPAVIGTSPRDRKLDTQVDRLVRKALRTNSQSSMSSIAEGNVIEAMVPMTEQLKVLTATCSVMAARIEQLQKNQERMLSEVSPVSSETDGVSFDELGVGSKQRSFKEVELALRANVED